MVCQHPDVSPAGAPDVFQAFDVFDELVSAETVLLAVVLDREHDVLPSHVEEILWMPVDAEQGDLSGRPWKAGVYQHGAVRSDIATIEVTYLDPKTLPDTEVPETDYVLLSDEDFDEKRTSK